MRTIRKLCLAAALVAVALGFGAACIGGAVAGPSSAMVPPDPY